jgi:mRNA interferase MazF
MELVTPLQDEVWLVALDPTVGSEIQKIRPCLVVSPDVMNSRLRTVIVAPMTSTERAYPSRVAVTFQKHRGHVALDQVRCVDRQRLVRRLGIISPQAVRAVAVVLVEMFQRAEEPAEPVRAL